ncbi:hypothetical protein D3C84_923490 [compost metagenome]
MGTASSSGQWRNSRETRVWQSSKLPATAQASTRSGLADCSACRRSRGTPASGYSVTTRQPAQAPKAAMAASPLSPLLAPTTRARPPSWSRK